MARDLLGATPWSNISVLGSELGWSNEFPELGHRPPGTERACANLAGEGRASQIAYFIATFAATEAIFTGVATKVHNAFQALEDMDCETDEESEAPVENGEDAKTAKGATRARARAARREQYKVCESVVATIGEH